MRREKLTKEKLEEQMKKWILSQWLEDSHKFSPTKEFRKCLNLTCGVKEPRLLRIS